MDDATPLTTHPPLSEHELAAVVSKLNAGEPLDEYWRQRLFPQPKEAELSYAGKKERGRILNDTLGVPLQTLKRFGEAEDGAWTNRLIFGENLQVLKTLLDMKQRGELLNADGTPGFRVCYIDPPFATRREFRGSQGQRAYRDKIDEAEFIEFLRQRLIFVHELLAEDGTLYVHLDPKKGHYVKVVLDEIFGPNNFRNEIVWWYYNKMQGNVNRFASNHDCIYVYGKGPHALFSPVQEQRDVKASLIKRVWDGDSNKLVNAKDEDGKVIYIEKDDKRVDDVWRLSMLQPADRTEKVDFPTQKPESLLSIALAASSNPGDLVLDCFVGSGTTATAAERLGRRWVAVDCGKLSIYTTQRRLLSLKEGRGRNKGQPITPFEVCSGGLYDNDLLEQLSPVEFEDFCLELFGCKRQLHEVVGVRMTGMRKGNPVYFFPYHEVDLDMGMDFIESLHDRVKAKLSGTVYLVAPASRCERSLATEIVKLGRNTYFILRVPFSAIELLNGRRFEVLDQPTSETAVNDAVEAFGFSFVRVPEVQASSSRTAVGLHVELKSLMRGGLDPEDFAGLPNAGREDLAMVMVDANYDSDIFRLTNHWFGEKLQEASWTFDIPVSAGAERVQVIWMDTHGNEAREIIELVSTRRSKSRGRAAA